MIKQLGRSFTILMGQNAWSLGGSINSSTGSDAAVAIRENVTFKKKALSFIYSNVGGLGLNINT